MKTWQELKQDYREACMLPIYPKPIKYQSNGVIDEEKSVRWNREEVKRLREEFDKETLNMREVRKKQILAVIEESINTLADDANLSYDKAKKVWEYLRYFKDTEDLYDCIEDYIDLICIINDRN